MHRSGLGGQTRIANANFEFIAQCAKWKYWVFCRMDFLNGLRHGKCRECRDENRELAKAKATFASVARAYAWPTPPSRPALSQMF